MKTEVIKNEFEETPWAVDKIDRKYLRYVQEFQGAAVEDAFNAFRSKDINAIEQALKNLADSQNTALFLIGLGAMIIEREKLFIKAGYVSYIEYTQHLFEEYDIPISTVSDYKIIMERYIDNYKALSKAGFRLLRNANKLRYLDDALSNHDAVEVYGRIANDTFRAFRDWAKKKAIIHKPGPDYWVNAKIEGNVLFVDGVSILNFPEDLDETRRELVKNDLQKTFSIRKGGNLPFIIETYDTGEQLSLENHLKRIREKK